MCTDHPVILFRTKKFFYLPLVTENFMGFPSGSDGAMQEIWVQSLGWEDPLEKEMAAHSSILAWKIPWMQEPGRLQSVASKRVGHD